jgi:hypothetical protein
MIEELGAAWTPQSDAASVKQPQRTTATPNITMLVIVKHLSVDGAPGSIRYEQPMN